MKHPWIRLALSIVVSLLILWLLLQLISDAQNPISFGDVTAILGEVSVEIFALFFIIHLLGIVLRTFRFQILIKAADADGVPSLAALSLVTLVRNMTVDMLPARIGELFYVGLLNRGLNVRLDVCFSSLAISMWFDVLVIIPLIFGLVVYPIIDAGVQTRLLVVAVVLVIACAVGLLILYPGLEIMARWLQRFSTGDSKLIKALKKFVGEFAQSVKRSLTWQTIIKIFLLTVGVRFCKYSSIALLFSGIAAAGFPELAGIDPASIVIGLLASEAGASLPIPAFMSFGTYEAGGLAAFAMLGLPTAAAGLALFSVHLVTQLVDYSIGGVAFVVFLLITGMGLSAVRNITNRQDGSSSQ